MVINNLKTLKQHELTTTTREEVVEFFNKHYQEGATVIFKKNSPYGEVVSKNDKAINEVEFMKHAIKQERMTRATLKTTKICGRGGYAYKSLTMTKERLEEFVKEYEAAGKDKKAGLEFEELKGLVKGDKQHGAVIVDFPLSVELLVFAHSNTEAMVKKWNFSEKLHINIFRD